MEQQAVAQRFKAASTTPVNDRTRYLGYSAGVPNMTIDARDSNLPCDPIEGGVLLTFAPGVAGFLGAWDTMKGGFRRQYIDIMPWQYALNVDRKFHIVEDLGYRTLPMLKGLPYEFTDGQFIDEAQDYFNAVHPVLNKCPFGLNQKVLTTEPSVGHAEPVWQHCPTCRLAHLRLVGINTAGRDANILSSLRELLIEANEAALRFVEQKTTLIMGDISNRRAGQPIGRTGLNTIDRIMLKMQHRKEDVQGADPVETMANAFQQAVLRNSPQQPPAAPPVQAPVVQAQGLTDDERAELEAFREKQRAARERMEHARNAKNKENNDESTS